MAGTHSAVVICKTGAHPQKRRGMAGPSHRAIRRKGPLIWCRRSAGSTSAGVYPPTASGCSPVPGPDVISALLPRDYSNLQCERQGRPLSCSRRGQRRWLSDLPRQLTMIGLPVPFAVAAVTARPAPAAQRPCRSKWSTRVSMLRCGTDVHLGSLAGCLVPGMQDAEYCDHRARTARPVTLEGRPF